MNSIFKVMWVIENIQCWIFIIIMVCFLLSMINVVIQPEINLLFCMLFYSIICFLLFILFAWMVVLKINQPKFVELRSLLLLSSSSSNWSKCCFQNDSPKRDHCFLFRLGIQSHNHALEVPLYLLKFLLRHFSGKHDINDI